jgi:uncharacterized membrane protein
MLLGAGLPEPALGALLLLVANVICVNLAAVATFVAQGIRPRRWWEAKRAAAFARAALTLWVLLLLAVLGAIYVERG